MKAGAAALHRQLRSHPDVFMPELTEPNFFVTEKNWTRGFDWYRSLFAGAPEGALLGEASTNYSKGAIFGGVPERLHSYVPDLKIIYLLRDPIQRIRSHYDHAAERGREKRSPESAITRRSTYLRTSLYGAELQRYLEWFPSEQILVLLTEDLRDDPEPLLVRVQEFLDLPRYSFPAKDSSPPRGDRTARDGDPPRVWDRLLKKPVEADALTIPAPALDRIRGDLAADRELLQRLVGIDLTGWQSLERC
ncbi:Sulfotransferase domain-containing protein [Microlunatus soli]|uniref:Sulfotransferase domain-containing protein n=2 Tax=Microlunatus soli TaxID=630515 RepID=A0A1H2ANK0_9ACTN|nr:Sulfotransferase domain-containing protein [Microlunatus soli]